ncbi:MAG TPA: CBS domain-containing protein [Candidatus Kapabacteria bacterium]|nr:CBS domain-containing protein [Candidatus Kapabacteria bacterium]
MNVHEIMEPNVQWCRPDTNLAEAAAMMWQYDCGILPVIDGNGKVYGTITDRDICIAAGTRNMPASQIKVDDVMSHHVVSCDEDDDVETALNAMRAQKVRRLPVTNAGGQLSGIISITDVIRHANDARRPGKAGIPMAGALKALQEINTREPRENRALEQMLESAGVHTGDFDFEE